MQHLLQRVLQAPVPALLIGDGAALDGVIAEHPGRRQARQGLPVQQGGQRAGEVVGAVTVPDPVQRLRQGGFPARHRASRFHGDLAGSVHVATQGQVPDVLPQHQEIDAPAIPRLAVLGDEDSSFAAARLPVVAAAVEAQGQHRGLGIVHGEFHVQGGSRGRLAFLPPHFAELIDDHPVRQPGQGSQGLGGIVPGHQGPAVFPGVEGEQAFLHVPFHAAGADQQLRFHRFAVDGDGGEKRSIPGDGGDEGIEQGHGPFLSVGNGEKIAVGNGAVFPEAEVALRFRPVRIEGGEIEVHAPLRRQSGPVLCGQGQHRPGIETVNGAVLPATAAGVAAGDEGRQVQPVHKGGKTEGEGIGEKEADAGRDQRRCTGQGNVSLRAGSRRRFDVFLTDAGNGVK